MSSTLDSSCRQKVDIHLLRISLAEIAGKWHHRSATANQYHWIPCTQKIPVIQSCESAQCPCMVFDHTYSAEAAPLFPVLKLSMNRTVFFSKATAVPPLVTTTTGLWALWACWTNVRRIWSIFGVFCQKICVVWAVHSRIVPRKHGIEVHNYLRESLTTRYAVLITIS